MPRPSITSKSFNHPYYQVTTYIGLGELIETVCGAVEDARPGMLSRYMQERLEIAARRVRERLDEAYGDGRSIPAHTGPKSG